MNGSISCLSWIHQWNRLLFTEKLSHGVERNFFLNTIYPFARNMGVNILEKVHFNYLGELFWKKLSISFIYSQKRNIWATEKQNSFAGFPSAWKWRGWPHPLHGDQKEWNIMFSEEFQSIWKISCHFGILQEGCTYHLKWSLRTSIEPWKDRTIEA